MLRNSAYEDLFTKQAGGGLISGSVFGKQSISKQEEQNKSKRKRQARVRLHQHPEVNYAGDR